MQPALLVTQVIIILKLFVHFDLHSQSSWALAKILAKWTKTHCCNDCCHRHQCLLCVHCRGLPCNGPDRLQASFGGRLHWGEISLWT